MCISTTSHPRSAATAGLSGEKVRAVTSFQILAPAAMAARALYDELRAHGVRIFEYTPAFLHAKVAVVDDDWATVGSSNIDPLSLLLNLEANVIVRDAGFAAELSAQFESALAASTEIDPAQKYRPGLLGALRRGVVAWIAHVYLRVAGSTGRY